MKKTFNSLCKYNNKKQQHSDDGVKNDKHGLPVESAAN